MELQKQIDNLIEIAIEHRAQIKELVEQLPELRIFLGDKIRTEFEELEPEFKSDLWEFYEQRASEYFEHLENETRKKYTALILERDFGLELLKSNEQLLEQNKLVSQQTKEIVGETLKEFEQTIPSTVKTIVTDELSRFPRANQIDQLRKEFAEPKGLNPRGKWSSAETYQRLDLVSINGDSYISVVDNNKEKPSKNSKNWTLSAARGSNGGGGGVTSLVDLLGPPSQSQIDIVASEGSDYVKKALVAGSNINITESSSDITISSISGSGTVTSVSVATANGISGTVQNPTTTPEITLSLGAITPSSVSASGTITGSNLSGTNTGDQAISIQGDVTASSSTSLLNATVTKINGTSLAGLATGILKNTTTSGVPSIAVAGDFPTLNQNTTGTAANVTGTVAIVNGGTGATTAADGRTNLGLGSAAVLTAGAANGAATLDGSGKLTSTQIPDIAISDYLGSVASQSAMLALTGQKGDWCTRSDLGTNWIITGNDPTQLSSWTQLSYPTAPVTSVFGRTGTVVATNGDYTASKITNVPSGAIAATDVQAALNELDSEKLAKASNLSDLASASTARINLGLGSIATQDSNSVSITGGSITGITDLAIADGGTGLSTIPTNGKLLIGNGTGYSLANLTAGTAISITNSAGGITIDSTEQAQTLIATVTNAESVAITRGQVVYAYGATGNRLSVKLAYNTSDATSAKTLGVVSEASIAAGTTGQITLVGVVDKLNLGSYSDGDSIYLGATAGSITNVKPYAPNHLVYVGIIERANAGNGELYVRIQNGYELNEIHDVQITTTPSAGSVLIYDNTNSLWKAANLTAGTGVSISNGNASASISISNTTVSAASYGSASKVGTFTVNAQGQLTAASDTSISITSSQAGLGNVTNDAQTKAAIVPNTVPSAGQLLVANAGGTAYAPVSASGDLTIASTGVTTIGASKVTNAMLAGSIDLTSKVTGALPVANGGTAATTIANARINLLPSYTGNANKVLALNAGATDVEWTSGGGGGTVTSIDVSGGTTGLTTSGGPVTTTGTITLSGTLNVGNGGTGATTLTGILKGNGTSAFTAATAGTDYLTPSGSGASLTGITATQVGLGNVTNDAQTKAAVVPNTLPTAGQILVGNSGGTAYAPVSSSGDVTLGTTGVFTIGASKVTNAMLAGSIDLTTKVTGTLPVANGGSGAATLTGILKGNGTSAFTAAVAGTDYLAPTGSGASLTGITATQVGLGNVTNDAQTKATIVPNTTPTSGQILVGNAGGTAYAAVSSSGDVTVASTGAFTIGASKVTNAMLAGSIDLATKITGTLAVANGGTGQTTYTNGQLLIGNTTGNTLTKATLTAGSGITITNGTGSITIATSSGSSSSGSNIFLANNFGGF